MSVSRSTIAGRVLSIVRLIGSILAAVQLSGCTLIVAANQASKPDHTSFPAWDLRNLGPGTTIVLVLRDGEHIQGKHAGLVSIPEAEYAEIYGATREEQPGQVLLPALGDTVTVVDAHDRHVRCEFLGFVDPLCAWVRIEGEPGPRGIPLVHVRHILDRDGASIQGEIVAGLLAEGELPIRTAILIDDGEARRQVPMEEISEVLIPRKKGGALTAILAGAAVDVLIILTLRAIGSGLSIGPAIHL